MSSIGWRDATGDELRFQRVQPQGEDFPRDLGGGGVVVAPPTDSVRFREALDALDLVVLVDVAFTETARHADYVLPAASQFEKWECTFQPR